MILDGAPSAELKALLDGIADLDSDAGPKYTPDTFRRLVGLIVGRAYAPPLLELCHLMRVAALAPRGRIEQFFWGVPAARPSAYAGWIAARTRAAAPAARAHLQVVGAHPAPAIEPEPGGVAIVYADGRFSIAYGRMPLLAALMEFLVSSIGYEAVLERVGRLLAGPPLIAAAGEAANEFARALYAWLTPHLPTAHEKRRLEALIDWLVSRSGAQDFSTGDIDDATVLDFWLAAELDEFRTFAAVLRGFLLLIEAMEDAAAATGVARAARIGTDAGEIDIAVPPGGRGRVWRSGGPDPDEDPLAALAEPPAAAVKLLNGRERDGLDELLSAGPRGERLPLSLARRAVFGGVQARISEALRRGGLTAAARILAALVDGIDPPRDGGPAAEEAGYAGWCARAAALDAHLERAMLASLHVLARAGRPEAVHLVVALGGRIELPEGAENHHPDARMAEAIRRLQDPAVAGPAIAALMLRARRSFQGFSRAGFEADAPARPATVEGHAAAAAHLPRLAARLARARAALARRSPEAWAAQQEADRSLFAARFARIYGLLPVETSP